MSNGIDLHVLYAQGKIQGFEYLIRLAITVLMAHDPGLDTPEGDLLKDIATAYSKYETKTLNQNAITFPTSSKPFSHMKEGGKIDFSLPPK
jgi:hypothetical protein